MVNRRVTRQDLKIVEIPANELAEKMGDMRLANMFLMGGLLANHPILPIDAVEKALKDHLPERHQHLYEKNKQAIYTGATYSATGAA